MKMNIKTFKNKQYPVYDKLPKGWVIIKGATTAPCGYKWISNNKSRFSGERKLAFIYDRKS